MSDNNTSGESIEITDEMADIRQQLAVTQTRLDIAMINVAAVTDIVHTIIGVMQHRRVATIDEIAGCIRDSADLRIANTPNLHPAAHSALLLTRQIADGMTPRKKEALLRHAGVQEKIAKHYLFLKSEFELIKSKIGATSAMPARPLSKRLFKMRWPRGARRRKRTSIGRCGARKAPATMNGTRRLNMSITHSFC